MLIASISLLTPVLITCAAAGNFRTAISIDGMNFRINGRLTYEGCGSEATGKLMNVRMVNSVFDDENPATRPAGFDPEANTSKFIDSMDQYRAKGILAFIINLQGGFPGYEGAINTAFRADGSLKEEYMNRVSRVIEAADVRGMVIILGFFYQRQDEILPNADAVREATANAAAWVRDKGYTNVIIEIANEYPHKGFADIIRTEDGEVELINIVRSKATDLIVSTSGIGDCEFHEKLCNAADIILIHGNGCNPEIYAERVNSFKKYRKPIVFNEDWCFSDDPRGIPDAVQKATSAFKAGASWGIMNQKRNQHWPFIFGIGNPEVELFQSLKTFSKFEGGNAREDFIAYETIAKLVGN